VLFFSLTYADIYLDIEEECSKYGKISEILIPRPEPEQTVPGLGKIYVEFETADECVNAQKNLAGRMFNDRAVITAYLDETRFKERQL
jgi:splicing factor U2AF subunit